MSGGPRYLLCFHGFGQNSNYYSVLHTGLAKHYTIIAFDLFFHGKSTWPDCQLPVPARFMSDMLLAFCQEKGINRFSLCAYSMGGKIALCVTELLADRIDLLLLAAPDGIHMNIWYKLATQNCFTRKLFKQVIASPALLFRILTVLTSLRILDQELAKFVRSQIRNQSKRNKVYGTWLTYRKLNPNLRHLAEVINDEKIKVLVYLGKSDQIVTIRKVQPLLSHLNSYQLVVLDSDHKSLIKDMAAYAKIMI